MPEERIGLDIPAGLKSIIVVTVVVVTNGPLPVVIGPLYPESAPPFSTEQALSTNTKVNLQSVFHRLTGIPSLKGLCPADKDRIAERTKIKRLILISGQDI